LAAGRAAVGKRFIGGWMLLKRVSARWSWRSFAVIATTLILAPGCGAAATMEMGDTPYGNAFSSGGSSDGGAGGGLRMGTRTVAGATGRRATLLEEGTSSSSSSAASHVPAVGADGDDASEGASGGEGSEVGGEGGGEVDGDVGGGSGAGGGEVDGDGGDGSGDGGRDASSVSAGKDADDDAMSEQEVMAADATEAAEEAAEGVGAHDDAEELEGNHGTAEAEAEANTIILQGGNTTGPSHLGEAEVAGKGSAKGEMAS